VFGRCTFLSVVNYIFAFEQRIHYPYYKYIGSIVFEHYQSLFYLMKIHKFVTFVKFLWSTLQVVESANYYRAVLVSSMDGPCNQTGSNFPLLSNGLITGNGAYANVANVTFTFWIRNTWLDSSN
jgi:hypothetical protein